MGRRESIALLISGLVAGGCGDNLNVGPAGAGQTVETDEDTAVDITLAGDDPNGDQVEFTIVRAPASGVLSGTAPEVTYTPDENFFGADMFVYAVSDDEVTEAFEVVVMVLPVNDAPTIAAISDQTGDEDVGVGPIILEIEDVDDDIDDLAIAASSSNLALVHASGIEIDRTTADVELSVSPLADQFGDSVIGVTVTDSGGLSDSTSFNLTIAPVNDAPTISDIADQSTVRDPVNDIAFTVDDIDSAVSGLTLSPTSSDQSVVPDGNLSTGGADANRTISVEPIASGTATITVTVSDGAASSSDTFSFDVTNNPPNAVADSYGAIGNTVLSVGAVDGVLTNDSDDDGGDTVSLVDPGGAIATTRGGSVLLNPSDGSFVYTPPVGVTGVNDSFQYELTDGFDVSTGTATIGLTDLVWYVQNDAVAGGNGQSNQPFDTLAEAETAATNSGFGADTIYVARGDGNTTGQDAGITLESGQRLIGSGVPLVINGTEILPADGAGAPSITNNAGDGVSIDDDNTVAGLTIDEPSNRGIAGTGITTVEIRTVTINIADAAAVNTGINLNNNNLDVTATIDIIDTTITGVLAGSNPTETAINISVGFTSGDGTLEADISQNTIADVDDGIVVEFESATGTGGGGANLVTLGTNLISDFEGAAINIFLNDTSVNEVSFLNNLIDGDSGTGNLSGPGINVRASGDAGSESTLTFTDNEISDCDDHGIAVADSGNTNAGTVSASFATNTLTNNSTSSIDVAVGDAQTFVVSARGTLATGNGDSMSFRLLANSAAIMRVLLENNDDSRGYDFDCDDGDSGDLQVGGDPNNGNFPVTVGCDGTGETTLATELDGLGNQTSGGVNLSGAVDATFTLVDPTVGFP